MKCFDFQIFLLATQIPHHKKSIITTILPSSCSLTKNQAPLLASPYSSPYSSPSLTQSPPLTFPCRSSNHPSLTTHSSNHPLFHSSFPSFFRPFLSFSYPIFPLFLQSPCLSKKVPFFQRILTVLFKSFFQFLNSSQFSKTIFPRKSAEIVDVFLDAYFFVFFHINFSVSTFQFYLYRP